MFTLSKGVIIRNSVGKLAKNVDVRGEGGYIIIAPSCRSDGRCYTWENKKKPSEAPDWLVTLVNQDKVKPVYGKGCCIQNTLELHPYVKKAVEDEYDKVQTASKGERNETLNKAAFTLYQFVAGGVVDENQIHTILIQAANECGLTQDDGEASVVKTINSGKYAGIKHPRSIPCSSNEVYHSKKVQPEDSDTLENLQEILPSALPPPMGAFPQEIQRMLSEVTKTLVVPLPVVVATFLATLSCCIGRSRAIRIKKGWIAHGNLWIILLASSSVGKTPALDFFFKHIHEVEQKHFIEWKKRWRSFEILTLNGNERRLRKGSEKNLVSQGEYSLFMMMLQQKP